MAGSKIKGYNILVTGNTKILVDDTEEIKEIGVTVSLNFLSKTAYNKIILSQEDTVCFNITEEARTKPNDYKGSNQARVKLSRLFDPTTGYSKVNTTQEILKVQSI